MNASKFEVECLDWPSSKTYGQMIAAFEQKVPAAEMAMLLQLVVSGASITEIEKVVLAMSGDLGFMHLVKLD